MTVWRTEFSIAVVLFLLTFPIALIFLTYHHYHRHGTFRGWSAVFTTATFMYVTGVIAFVFFPFPDAGTSNCIAGEARVHAQLVPFNSLESILEVWRTTGFPGVLTTITFLQVALNVLLLVPLGMLLAYRYKRSFGITVLAGLSVSLLIEVTQGTGVLGAFDCPYRLADVDDLITNTTGAAIGWVIATIIMEWLPDPTPPPHPDLGPPRAIRRLFAGALDVLSLLLVGILVRGTILIVFRPTAERLEESWVSATMTFLDVVAVAILLFLILPIMRRDRATPGQIATWLSNSSVTSGQPARRSQALIRFGVRWLPIAIGAFIEPLAFLAAVAVYETATVLIRSDRRSLSDVLAGTVTVTRRSLDVEDGSSPSKVDQPGTSSG
jgi:glycopeptide antibiotics resistance protein